MYIVKFIHFGKRYNTIIILTQTCKIPFLAIGDDMRLKLTAIVIFACNSSSYSLVQIQQSLTVGHSRIPASKDPGKVDRKRFLCFLHHDFVICIVCWWFHQNHKRTIFEKIQEKESIGLIYHLCFTVFR